MTDTLTPSTEPEIAPLDAYSQVVVTVAEHLTPRVAACRYRSGAVTVAFLPAQVRLWCSRTTASY